MIWYRQQYGMGSTRIAATPKRWYVINTNHGYIEHDGTLAECKAWVANAVALHSAPQSMFRIADRYV